jgi:copper/silver efflux system protein
VAFAGEAVSQVLEQQRSFDLVVRFAEPYRGSLDAIRNARIGTPDGSQVALGRLQTCAAMSGRTPSPARTCSARSWCSRTSPAAMSAAWSRTSASGRAHGQPAAGLLHRVRRAVRVGGAAARRIALLSLLSLAAILLLLYMEFGSARQALLVMVNLPLALVGGVFAVLITGGVLNIATLVGFITLFGIAVRNGVLMVSHYNQLLREGARCRRPCRGSMERLNPIFMTALTAGLALLPLALAGGQPGNEIQSPAGRRRARRAAHLTGAQHGGGAGALHALRRQQHLCGPDEFIVGGKDAKEILG